MKYNYLNLDFKQLVLIVILVVALELSLGLWGRRIELNEDSHVIVTYMGFPFESVKIKRTIDSELAHSSEDPLQILHQHIQGDNSATGYAYWDPGEGGLSRETFVIKKTSAFLWIGITFNTMFFAIISFPIVKLAAWIRNKMA